MMVREDETEEKEQDEAHGENAIEMRSIKKNTRAEMEEEDRAILTEEIRYYTIVGFTTKGSENVHHICPCRKVLCSHFNHI